MSQPPASYIPSIPSSIHTAMRLLVPMPIPHTPGAPYFDEHGVRAFLDLILLHGSNAGISDADELVSFIVRYSSQRVRQVIQYIPEIDPDEPNRTWSAAKEQMLLLYGSMDEDRLVSERDLVEFCRERSAKSPFRTKQEIEKYLRDFQLIAAPLVKQKDITIAQRDFYFISGIPTSIKEWFISRVPETQRTRSNPIPLADSLKILYGHFDPDSLFPNLWDELGNLSAPPVAISPPVTPRITHSTTIHLPAAVSTPSLSSPEPLPSNAIVSSLAFLTAPLIALDKPASPKLEPTLLDSNNNPDLCEDSSMDDKLQVLPSEDLPQDLDDEKPVYFCLQNKFTDRIFELRRILEQASALGIRSVTELSRVCDSLESDAHDMTANKFEDAVFQISKQIQDEVQQQLARRHSEDVKPQISSFYSSEAGETGSVTGSEFDSIFEYSPESGTELDEDAMNSCSMRADTDCVGAAWADFDSEYDLCQDSTMDVELEVLPSQELPQELDEHPVYFCSSIEFADRIFELRRILDQASTFGMHCVAELSSICDSLESRANNVTANELENVLVKVSTQVQEEFKQFLARTSSDGIKSQISASCSVDFDETGTTAGSEVERKFEAFNSGTGLDMDATDSDSVNCSLRSDLAHQLEPSELDVNPKFEDKQLALISFNEPIELDASRCAAAEADTEQGSHGLPDALTITSPVTPTDIQKLEMLDIQIQEATGIVVESKDDPPSYQKEVQIEAEYLHSLMLHLAVCWTVLSGAFGFVKSVMRSFACGKSKPEIHDSLAITSFKPKDEARVIKIPGAFDGYEDPVPPDKIPTFTDFSLVYHTSSLHSELTEFSTQDFDDILAIPQCVRRFSDSEPSEYLDDDSVYHRQHDFQHDMCEPFISFEPFEHPSNQEPSERAELQLFFPRTFHVDFPVPERPESEFDFVPECTASTARPEPCDDPPSYQDSVRATKSRFTSSNHRKKDESIHDIPRGFRDKEFPYMYQPPLNHRACQESASWPPPTGRRDWRPEAWKTPSQNWNFLFWREGGVPNFAEKKNSRGSADLVDRDFEDEIKVLPSVEVRPALHVAFPSRELQAFSSNIPTRFRSPLCNADSDDFTLRINYSTIEHHSLTFILHTTYRQRDEFNHSLRASRTTPGIDFEMDWAPIFDAERGSEHLPIRLCVPPGLLLATCFEVRASISIARLSTLLYDSAPLPARPGHFSVFLRTNLLFDSGGFLGTSSPGVGLPIGEIRASSGRTGGSLPVAGQAVRTRVAKTDLVNPQSASPRLLKNVIYTVDCIILLGHPLRSQNGWPSNLFRSRPVTCQVGLVCPWTIRWTSQMTLSLWGGGSEDAARENITDFSHVDPSQGDLGVYSSDAAYQRTLSSRATGVGGAGECIEAKRVGGNFTAVETGGRAGHPRALFQDPECKKLLMKKGAEARRQTETANKEARRYRG
ncbi:hypothetical protein B0H12DRAFT_1079440 [Mycena haematopus]|nr:hypothetical protein B0H12DRAFT_1079440 [Mycena haematopus]